MMNVTPRYFEMLEQARTNLMSVGSFPKDPLEFAVQWYNATSGPFSEFIQDVIEREEFLEPASEWLQHYASFYKLFARRSEEYLKSLQVPVRSDITRVAGLVVALEDKVDRLEEAFEEFEYGYAKPATAEELGELEKRFDRVEEAGPAPRCPGERNAQNGAPEATDAARRKARELGVDLTEIVGTGAGARSRLMTCAGEEGQGDGAADERRALGARGLPQEVQQGTEDRRRGCPGRHGPDSQGDRLDQEQGQALPLRAWEAKSTRSRSSSSTPS